MTQDLSGCTYPHCDAADVLREVKESNKEYRSEIKGELGGIKGAVDAMVALLQEDLRKVALLEQAIKYLYEGERRNEKAHDGLGARIGEMEDKIIAMHGTIGSRIGELEDKIIAMHGTTGSRLWDMVRMLITLGAGLLIGKLT